MAAPTFVKAGAGSTDATGAWSHTGPAPAAVGNLLICQILVDGTTAGTPTISSTTNIESLAGVSGQWTAAPGNPYAVGSPTAAGQLLFFARATSTSAPVITGANSGGDDVYVRIYEFANVNTGTTLSDILENSTAGTLSNGVGTSTTISDTGVTTIGPDRLALQLVGANDDIAIDAFAGETGGDWTEATAEYADSSGTDASIQLQIASPRVVDLDYLTDNATVPDEIGQSTTNERRAQSFVAGGTHISAVAVRLIRTGSPVDNLIVEIQTDASGAPSGTVVGTSVSVAASSIATSKTNYTFAVEAPVTNGNTYWIVLRRSGAISGSAYIGIAFSSVAYANGVRATYNGTSWATSTGDRAFAVYLNKAGTIDGGSDAVVSAGWGVVGFALIGTTPSGPATVERSADIAATAGIVSVPQRAELRSAAISATATVAVSGTKVTVHSRSAALDATASIATSATFFSIFARSAALDATASIATSGISIVSGSAAISATAIIDVSGTDVAVFSRSAAISATAGVASVPRRELLRSSAISATGTISSSGISVVSGSAALSATAMVAAAGVVVSGAQTFERSASLAATASIASSGISIVSAAASFTATASIASSATFFSIFARAAALAATASISSVPRRELFRSTSVAASGSLAISGTFFSIIERTSATNASATISVSAIRVLPRSAALAASATISTDPERVLFRSLLLGATGDVRISGSQGGVSLGNVSVDASAGISVSGVHRPAFARSASLNATAGVAISGQIRSAFERSASLTATAGISISGIASGVWVRSISVASVADIDSRGVIPPDVATVVGIGVAPNIARPGSARVLAQSSAGRIATGRYGK